MAAQSKHADTRGLRLLQEHVAGMLQGQPVGADTPPPGKTVEPTEGDIIEDMKDKLTRLENRCSRLEAAMRHLLRSTGFSL